MVSDLASDYSPSGSELHLTASLSPGRFFAVNEMKALIAHIIVTYDFKFQEGKVVLDGHQIGIFRDPGNIDMMFRKRRNRC